jgi:hypothetical protein
LQGSHNVHNTKHITAAATAAYNIYNIDVTRLIDRRNNPSRDLGGERKRKRRRRKKKQRSGEGEEIYIQFAALATS